MNLHTSIAPVAFHDFQPELDDFFQDTLQGLSKPQKELPAKYFYDERGSMLFDQICDLDEYYQTRTEIGLLQAHSAEIAEIAGENCVVIEYGSGSSRKVPILLSALRKPLAYMPIDICKEYLLASSDRIAAAQPGVAVIAICADYTELTHLPHYDERYALYQDVKKLLFFPGSTIGNYTPIEAIRLLKNAVKLVGAGGGMLIGVDLKKDPRLLHAAYNDAHGITAEFNLNVLTRINRELNADFDVSLFMHDAFYDAGRNRIEMHLRSVVAQTVRVGERAFYFAAGESIHTENSYKYSVAEFQDTARAAGFEPLHAWVDAECLFSLHYLRAP